uniref:Cyclin-K n=1 Tax=Ceriodaphnia reticulata TaxID=302197 RepID=A0A4Y7M040_9CRUS|nr:EOG090X09KD [Ceriodaphnia reticulata]SVE73059.1 EOG090X09KD [Ceriodaphnia reticulata]
MPCWYYEKKDLKRETPSIQDGIDFETESRYRKEGARFIIDTGTKMGLRYDTMATGVVYFHRFYMFHSFKEFPRYVTACCCLFLAGKVEETPKKCKDIIKVAKASLSETQFQQFGEDAKEEVMTLERILLQTIRFDLQVEHPYGYLIKYAKSLKGDKSKLQKMVQMAWTFVNDSLCTTLCLQWEPEVIAIALMYLAGKLSKFEIQDWSGRQPRHIRWWDMFVEDISLEILEDICHQVLDLYSQQPARTDSPQGSNSGQALAVTKLQPTLPITTPTKPVVGRGIGGFDQRLDAMQPKVEVAAAAGYVSYAMGVTGPTPLPVGVPPNINVAPPINVPHTLPPPPPAGVGHSFPFQGLSSSAPSNAKCSILSYISYLSRTSISSHANCVTTTPSSSSILTV